MKNNQLISTQMTQMKQIVADFFIICVNPTNLRYLRAKKPLYFAFLIQFCLAGCIERYHPQMEEIDKILAVEGIVTDGITKIALSYSVGLDKDLNKTTTENQAVVYVESEDGTKSAMTNSSGDGIYLIETGELNAGAKYRLVIQLAGEEYHSSFIAPAITPPVEISYIYDSVKSNISIRVSTTGDANQPGYYLWSYKEDWEIHALVYEQLFHNLYYCWRTDSSKVMLLGATEKLSMNTIREREIKTFNCTDDRIFFLYRIKVKQNVLNKEGYDYFENLQKNTEQTGSILGSIPSELTGNIRCVSNPRIPVIGYVDVSTTTTDELYLTNKYYDRRYRDWQITTCNGKDAVQLYQYCRDCTQNAGTKRKPIDWPNDHQ